MITQQAADHFEKRYAPTIHSTADWFGSKQDQVVQNVKNNVKGVAN